MNAQLSSHTTEIAQEPRRIERAECPYCHNPKVEVVRVGKTRMLQYHHPEGRGFFDWCKEGSDLNLDEYEASHT